FGDPVRRHAAEILHDPVAAVLPEPDPVAPAVHAQDQPEPAGAARLDADDGVLREERPSRVVTAEPSQALEEDVRRRLPLEPEPPVSDAADPRLEEVVQPRPTEGPRRVLARGPDANPQAPRAQLPDQTDRGRVDRHSQRLAPLTEEHALPLPQRRDCVR